MQHFGTLYKKLNLRLTPGFRRWNMAVTLPEDRGQ